MSTATQTAVRPSTPAAHINGIDVAALPSCHLTRGNARGCRRLCCACCAAWTNSAARRSAAGAHACVLELRVTLTSA